MPVTGRTRTAVIAVDRGVLALARHWLLAFNLFVLAYVGIPFLAPALMHIGWTGPAKLIYTIYSPLCHQLGYRSWFLFGAETHYPRAEFQTRTGIDPNDLWAARGYLGDETLGYKVAFCERDVAIYGGLLLAGLIYSLPGVRGRLPPLPWWGWVLLGLVPVGLDGFSQLFSQYPYNLLPGFNLLPARESTPVLRSLTGALFGLANVWLAYPYVEESMREVRQNLEAKLARVDAPPASPA
ncbi:MAG: DUF2085 domain-containing protein [Anaerolineales bacterium]|nr:DUF2085 domain-containing protein [Anaerolineales bacterium]